MKDGNFKITVLLPVFNAMPYLVDAVTSLISQTYKNFIVYCIDNGSTDGSDLYIKNIDDKRFRYYELEEADLVRALNFGLSNVDSEFVARMDADDISHPLRFEKQIEFLDNNKDIDVLGTQGIYFGSNSRKLNINLPFSHAEILRKMLNSENALLHPSIMYRSKSINKKFYKKDFFPCEDFEYFLRLSAHVKFANLPDRLLFFRIHKNSIISKNIKKSMLIYKSVSSKYAGLYTEYERRTTNKVFDTVDIVSITVYRKGLIQYLNKSLILGALYFSIASILNPRRLFKFFQKKYGLYFNNSQY